MNARQNTSSKISSKLYNKYGDIYYTSVTIEFGTSYSGYIFNYSRRRELVVVVEMVAVVFIIIIIISSSRTLIPV